MLCSSCHQNEATIHLTEIVNNQMMEVHLCESCAEEKGTDFKTHFNFHELFSSLANIEGVADVEEKIGVKCSSCGMTYREFGKIGRLGCADCYQSMSKLLLPLIKRVQRATAHLGKKPSKISGETSHAMDLRELKERLRKSVEAEAFEEAAKLRDEIAQLEEKIKKGKKNNGV